MPESAPPSNAGSGAQAEAAARQQAGALLRAAREAAGRSVAELATQLKVSPDKIAALEAGDWTSLHDDAHARGLLRASAKAVHADPDAVLRPLPPAFVRGTPVRPAKGTTLMPGRPATPVGTHGGSHRLVWLALLLLVLALGLLYLPRGQRIGRWLQQLRGQATRQVAPAAVPPQAASSASAAASAASAPAASAAPAAPAASSAAAPASAAASAALPAGAASSAGAAGAMAPAAAASAAGGGAVLGLRTSGSSWVQVRADSGKVLFSGLLAADASQAVAIGRTDYPLHVVVGNAAQTRLSLGGKAVPLHAGSGNVARLVLPASAP